MAQAVGLEYVSWPVPHRGVPESHAAAERLLGCLHVSLMRGRTVGVHCRMSVARASLVAASLLHMGDYGIDEAWIPVERARGCAVPDTEAQGS